MKQSNVPHFEILGAPIGDLVFCAKYVAQKRSEACKLLKQLEAVGSIDPQVALLLLRQCGSFSISLETGNEVHSNVTPHSLVGMFQWRRMAIMRVSSIFPPKNMLFVRPLVTTNALYCVWDKYDF